MADTARADPSSTSQATTFRLTLAVIGLYTAIAACLLPFACELGPEMPGFNAAFAGGVFVAELATSFLLLGLLRQTLRPSVLLLANAYLYSALMALAYLLTYPDAMMRGRILIGGPQTISWVYNCWIVGFASLTLAAVLQELGGGGPPMKRTDVRRAAYFSSATVLAVVAAIVVTVTGLDEHLPPLVSGNSWTLLNATFNYGGIVLFAASGLAILLLLRPLNDLFLWLSLALAAIALGNALSAYGGGRYTVGWYACRLSWSASSLVLLLYFLGQFVRQHGLLVRTTDDLEERTRERDRIWSVSEDLLGVSTFEGYFIALNPAWAKVLGWSEEEVRAMHVDVLRHPADMAHSRTGRMRLAAGIPTVRMENRFRHKDGSWRWIAWTMTADQGLIYVAGRDVTAEKEAQEALRKAEADAANRQKLEALGQLTGGVAHDFNNLLMIVSGFIPRLKRHAVGDAKATEAVQAIDMAAQRGASLTRQLLSFSRRQPVNPVAIAIGERIVALKPLLAGTVGPLIKLEFEMASDLWPVTVDANELELALLNLVLNARDAVSETGTIKLSAGNMVLLGKETPAKLTGEFVACTVTDTGHGIPADMLPKVFDPFFTTKKSEKGTGLGLSQVHGFTHQSGGTAVIFSSPGKGAAVTLYLPRSQALPEKAPAEPRPQPAPGGTALLIEDNAEVAEVGREMLGQLGYSVQLASNAHQALAMLDNLGFDLVMSDIVMPGGMNGIELARAIRTVRPELPILLVTGYAGSDTAPEFLVLRKPYRFEQLRQAIAELTGTAVRRDVA